MKASDVDQDHCPRCGRVADHGEDFRIYQCKNHMCKRPPFCDRCGGKYGRCPLCRQKAYATEYLVAHDSKRKV